MLLPGRARLGLATEGMAALQYPDLVRHPGNESLHQALEISILGLMRGHPLHVHVEGLRGTGKTTAVRAAVRLLPSIRRIRNCPYNCDPQAPHCPLHRDLSGAQRAELREEEVSAPFLEISPSAKIGTVAGSIDLARLTDPEHPQAALLPGTLARAHRGVVFVDEINRLADIAPELADALLDVMGTKPGRLQIEETGLAPVVLPCRVTVWAASNPDEEPGPLADIRRQLADRFDLMVAMRRPAEIATVAAVLDRDDFGGVSLEDGARAAERGRRLRQELMERAGHPVPDLAAVWRTLLAGLYCEFQIESLRAVQAWQSAARLQAQRQGRSAVHFTDLQATAALVLSHRLEPEELARLLDRLAREDPAAHAGPAAALAASTVVDAAQPPVVTVAPSVAEAAMEGAPVPARPLARWLRWGRSATPAGATAPGTANGSRPGGGPCAPGSSSAGTTQDRGASRLADPTRLPPIAPRAAASFLPDLPPAELWTPSWPADGAGRGGGAD